MHIPRPVKLCPIIQISDSRSLRYYGPTCRLTLSPQSGSDMFYGGNQYREAALLNRHEIQKARKDSNQENGLKNPEP